MTSKNAHRADETFKVARPEFPRGQGVISGILALFLSALGLASVITLRFPQFLTTPQARAAYPLPILRLVIDVVLYSGLALGLLSLVRGRGRSLRGLVGVALAIVALLLGGSHVPIRGPVPNTPYLALDRFLISILVSALIWIPLERLFPRNKQHVFRKGWRTDLTHFGVSHLLVQVTVLLTMLPAAIFFRWAVSDRLQAAVSAQPGWIQFVETLVLADLFAYGAHRLFHEVRFLWRFHQIHHSSEFLDWLAGSRLHIVDIFVTRAFGFLPLYVLGFSTPVLIAYAAWASFQSVFIHTNIRFKLGPLRYFIATPQYHHWHHSSTLYNKNFAVHLPFIDKLFGTYHLPGEEWPAGYGIKGNPVPDGYLRQLVYPLTKRGGKF